MLMTFIDGNGFPALTNTRTKVEEEDENLIFKESVVDFAADFRCKVAKDVAARWDA